MRRLQLLAGWAKNHAIGLAGLAVWMATAVVLASGGSAAAERVPTAPAAPSGTIVVSGLVVAREGDRLIVLEDGAGATQVAYPIGADAHIERTGEVAPLGGIQRGDRVRLTVERGTARVTDVAAEPGGAVGRWRVPAAWGLAALALLALGLAALGRRGRRGRLIVPARPVFASRPADAVRVAPAASAAPLMNRPRTGAAAAAGVAGQAARRQEQPRRAARVPSVTDRMALYGDRLPRSVGGAVVAATPETSAAEAPSQPWAFGKLDASLAADVAVARRPAASVRPRLAARRAAPPPGFIGPVDDTRAVVGW